VRIADVRVQSLFEPVTLQLLDADSDAPELWERLTRTPWQAPLFEHGNMARYNVLAAGVRLACPSVSCSAVPQQVPFLPAQAPSERAETRALCQPGWERQCACGTRICRDTLAGRLLAAHLHAWCEGAAFQFT